jgi:hypothetical protein
MAPAPPFAAARRIFDTSALISRAMPAPERWFSISIPLAGRWEKALVAAFNPAISSVTPRSPILT